MAFSNETVKQAWNRAESKCECKKSNCHGWGRCNKTLLWESHGKESQYGWEAHHINANGTDALSNCEILCQDCHKNTQTYGG